MDGYLAVIEGYENELTDKDFINSEWFRGANLLNIYVQADAVDHMCSFWGEVAIAEAW